MPRVNFDKVQDKFPDPLPEGKYMCQVKEIMEKTSKTSGMAFWVLKMQVVEGEHEGEYVEDAIFFTEKSEPRLKHVVKNLTGLPLKGDFDLEQDMLLGCRAEVDVELEEAEWDGKTIKRNKVAYKGYTAHQGGAKSSPSPDKKPDDIPF